MIASNSFNHQCFLCLFVIWSFSLSMQIYASCTVLREGSIYSAGALGGDPEMELPHLTSSGPVG